MDRRKMFGSGLAALLVTALPRVAALIVRTQRQFLAALGSQPGTVIHLGRGTFTVPQGSVVRGLTFVGDKAGKTVIRSGH